MMENAEKQFYGIQFHPEVTHTKQGRALLNRFVLDICGAQPSWTMPNYIEEAVAKIREQVGSDEVILGLSGGVDSSGSSRVDSPRYRRPTDLRVC